MGLIHSPVIVSSFDKNISFDLYSCESFLSPNTSGISVCNSVGVKASHLSIAQLDGIDDLFVFPPLTNQPTPPGHVPANPGAPPPYQSVRRAPYTLKQNKQLSGLCKDAKLTDFEITISPIAHNVNIKCSTGFYTLVVLPSFKDITEHFVTQVDGITVQCSSITGYIDGANSNTTAVVVFSLTYQDGSSAGAVTMHLHHTTRRVQLQGSALVYDKSRAPVWFVDNFIKSTFSLISKRKSVDISNFNTAVNNILTKHQQKVDSQEKCSS